MNNVIQLADLVDLSYLQQMAEAHYRTAGVPLGIIDAIDNSILVQVGWQEICLKFHRVNPESLKACEISDNFIKDNLREGEVTRYRCLSGLEEAGFPIMVGGQHLATLHIGQFFYDDAPPDRKFFRQQAKKYGFPAKEYLKVLDQVPVLSRERVDTVNQYNRALTNFIVSQAEQSLRQRRTERELKESQEYLDRVIENIPSIIFVKDARDLSYVRFNKKGQEYLGVSQEELLGKSDFDYFTQEQSDAFKEVDHEVLAKGTMVEVPEETTQIPNLGERIIRTRKVPVFHDDGTPLYLVGIAEDITEERTAQKRLQQLQSSLKNIIDSMPALLIAVDTHLNVTQWNRRAEEFTGIDANTAIGQPLAVCLPQLARYDLTIRNTIDYRRPQTEPRVTLTNGGSEQVTELTIYPLDDSPNSGAVLRLDDITERMQVERMMIQSEKMLSVGSLAAGMAHEITNPLAGVLQNSQVLLQRLDPRHPKNRAAANQYGLCPDALTEYVRNRKLDQISDSIHQSGHRAALTVKNLLGFSRRSSGAFSSWGLETLLEQAVDLASSDFDLKRQFDFRKIHIERHFVEDLPAILCDPSQIQQVFLNLLKNAAHALSLTEEISRPMIRLSLERGNGFVQAHVEDNGPGMSPETQKRIFEPFYTTKEPGAGTGLGLSVSSFIITEVHGGSLDVRTAPGKGARFTVQLPLHPPIDHLGEDD